MAGSLRTENIAGVPVNVVLGFGADGLDGWCGVEIEAAEDLLGNGGFAAKEKGGKPEEEREEAVQERVKVLAGVVGQVDWALGP